MKYLLVGPLVVVSALACSWGHSLSGAMLAVLAIALDGVLRRAAHEPAAVGPLGLLLWPTLVTATGVAVTFWGT